ncbi:Putative Transcriptional factor B3 [Rhizopus microsporus]|nr:Putative Transcriptional factor B3 [Rhizopus microsporus]
MLSHCNPFSRIYLHAHEILSRNEDRSTDGDLSNNINDHNESNNSPYIIISPSMRMRLIEGSDRRTQNLLTTEEIAAVIPIEYSDRNFRDTILTLRRRDRNDNIRQGYDFDKHIQRISQTHAAYMSTHYVLLFLHGTYGWYWGMCLSSSSPSSTATTTTTTMNEEIATSTRQKDRLSQRAYYRFRLHLRREHEFPAIFYAKKLFQQFLADAWAVRDQNKLDWIRHNQDRLRADVYNGLADAIAEGDQVNAANLGRRFILPSSHTIYILELDHKIRRRTTQESELPFILTRKQFPVKLCFSMTIKKSQGQSLKYVGIDLRRPSFMHDRLYVAFLRVTSLSGISVLLPESSNATNNVVYPELLLH